MNEIFHHGIKGMHWGQRLGPPYPLTKEAGSVIELLNDLKSIKYNDFDKLMSSKEVFERKSGSCHDQVMFEFDRLSKSGFSPKIEFFIEASNDGQGGTTHSLCYFQLNGKICWIENAWEAQKGLHFYSSKDSMINDVIRKWDKKPECPIIYSGSLDAAKMKPGMSLQQIVDLADF